MKTSLLHALTTVFTVALATTARAQDVRPIAAEAAMFADTARQPALVEPTRRRFAPSFSRSDGALLVGLGVAAVAAVPFDARISHAVADPSLQQSAHLRGLSSRVDRLAFPGVFLVSSALYGAGVVTGREGLADAGWHTIASVMVGVQASDVIKSAVGRTRPAAGALAHSSKSFPSSHATAASALSEELSHSAPRISRFANPALYLAATAVAASRVYGQAHWVSDVVAGAALGTFTARTLVRGSHAHPGNLVDKIFVHAVVGVGSEGRALIGWSQRR
jgi:membrane-associated phospholipid phosphatase